jgi:hypothetical protein
MASRRYILGNLFFAPKKFQFLFLGITQAPTSKWCGLKFGRRICKPWQWIRVEQWSSCSRHTVALVGRVDAQTLAAPKMSGKTTSQCIEWGHTPCRTEGPRSLRLHARHNHYDRVGPCIDELLCRAYALRCARVEGSGIQLLSDAFMDFHS